MKLRLHHMAIGFLLNSALSMIVAAQPVIGIQDTLIELGGIYRDQKVTHTVTITNSGDANLHIESVTSGCGCTTTQLMKADIPPGDSTQLSFTVNTSILEGKIHKYLLIVSNDFIHRNRFVYYNTEVMNVLRSTPSFLYLGDVPLHEEASGVLALVNASRRQIRILSVTSLSGKLKLVHFPDLLAPGDTMHLTVGLKVDQAATLKDEIRIEIDHEVQHIVRVGVVARGKER